MCIGLYLFIINVSILSVIRQIWLKIVAAATVVLIVIGEVVRTDVVGEWLWVVIIVVIEAVVVRVAERGEMVAVLIVTVVVIALVGGGG